MKYSHDDDANHSNIDAKKVPSLSPLLPPLPDLTAMIMQQRSNNKTFIYLWAIQRN